jgi:cell wall-associated NlpC family hydrolase
VFTVKQLSSKVRETIGTPFHHGGRVLGPNGGMDCGGIMVYALRSLGVEVFDKPFYNRGDGLADMEDVLEHNHFQRKDYGKPKPGDLILIRSSDTYHHLVYLTEDQTIIHAWFTTGLNKVVESTMLPEWEQNIHSIWRWKELESI